MSEYSDWNDEYPTEEVEEVEEPRNPLKDLRNQLKVKTRENKELNDRLAVLEKESRSNKVTAMLTEKGIPAQAAGLFPADMDLTSDSVNAWIETYGGLFGGTPTSGMGEPTNAAPSSPVKASTSTPATDPAQVAAIEAMQRMANGSAPSGGSHMPDLKSALENPNLANEMSFAEYKELLSRS